MTIGFLSHLDLNLYAFRLPVMLELKRLGHTPIAIAPHGNFLNKIKECGVEVVSYEIERKSLNPLKELKAIQNIYHAIKPLKLDILHTFTAKPNIYGTIAGKVARVPKIINLVEGLGSFYLEDNLKSVVVRNIIEGLYKQIFKLSNGVMFVNSDDPAYLVSKGVIDESKIFKINGVGIDSSAWVSQNIKRDTDAVKVIMVGRAIKHKGVVEFYEAASVLKKKYSKAEFIYVGGVDHGNHSALSDEYMRSNPAVNYLGERADIKELMNDSDIFVLPSYREGLPRTVLEAMSLSLPVVATNVVGCKECVVDGENGFLVPKQDIDALSFAIEKLILDGEKRAKFGSVGRKMAEDIFDVKEIVKAHLRIYGINE